MNKESNERINEDDKRASDELSHIYVSVDK